MWDEPRYERRLRRLASYGRLILFDKRGTGSSDPLDLRDNTFDVSLLEQANEAMLVVLDAVDSQRATVLGADTGGIAARLCVSLGEPVSP
jgi:pimeloyl-ACP methyl ester carboxylesterase